MCGCSEAPETDAIAVHNMRRKRRDSLYLDLTSRDSGRRLLILSYEEAVGICTTFQAGEPELHGEAAVWKKLRRETAGLAKEFLWRCNDEWLVSQV